METVQYPNKKFMVKFQRYEPVVQDHTAMIAFKTCQRMYFYRFVLGFQSKETPQFFGFGSCYHKFREVLDSEWLKLKPADHKTIGQELDWQLTAFTKAMNAAVAYWDKKKMRDPIVGDKFDFLTKGRLLESCTVAFKAWQKEKQQGRVEILAVEQNFVIQLPGGIKVGGKVDVFLRWNGKMWVRDYKTSSAEQDAYFIRTLDPNDQFMRYTWAGSELSGEQVNGVLVDVMYNAKGTKKTPKKGPEIHTHMSSRSSKQIEQWVKEQVHLNRQLEINRESDIWPMEEKSCRYCPFHSVCSKASEFAQMAKLEAEFKVEPWDCTNRDVDQD